jgi:hypothetical protein
MTKSNFIRDYLETLPDEALLAICRRGGMTEEEIERIRPRPPGPYECEVWPRKRDRRRPIDGA